MSYQPIEDSGEFNDSVVYMHPVRFTEQGTALSRPANAQQLHLGIYQNIKLSSFLPVKQGNIVELITLDVPSRHAFFTEEGEGLLRQYAANQIAFVMVAGNRGSGKSFFFDKILNLSQVRGNHFCRSKNTGINVWSSPFQKENLKIFLLQINGCNIRSQEFKILLTYAIMISSSFIVIDDQQPGEHTALEQFDYALAEIVDKITPSRLDANGVQVQKRNFFLPMFFYFLRRSQRKENQAVSVVSSFIEQKLPDARALSFEGDSQQLIHIPFLDKKCINQLYIRKVGSIFKQIHEVITERRYNELNLTGSILLKIIKYIQSYLNSNQIINVEDLYDRVIEDLYQSAYNYCILSYHEEMERQFEDEQPKSLDQLISIFEVTSSNVLERFQEFTLDQKFHQIYRQKLESHVDEKQIMILDINHLKTQRVIHSSYDSSSINDFESYKAVLKQLNTQYPNLNHGSAQGLGKLVAEIYSKTGGIDYKVLKQIDRLKAVKAQQQVIYNNLKQKNDQKSRERAQVNKQQQQLYQNEKRLENKVKDIKNQIQSAKNISIVQPQEIAQQRESLQEIIRRNNLTLNDLRKADGKKHKDVVVIGSKIQETGRNIAKLEKMLAQMRSSPQPQEANKEKPKPK